MTDPSLKLRVRRRGALLLILSALTLASPLGGIVDARADDGGSDGGGGGDGGNDGGDGGNDGNDGGGSDGGGDGGGGGGGNDDGGGDDGGGDDGGSDDNGGGSGSGSGSSGSGSSSSSGSGSGGSKGSNRSNSQSSRDGALATRLKGKIAPIRDIETIAGKAVPGEILDVKLYRNKDSYIYKVRIIQKTGSIYDVRINATTRKLLSARER